jgi:hypothetical protein
VLACVGSGSAADGFFIAVAAERERERERESWSKRKVKMLWRGERDQRGMCSRDQRGPWWSRLSRV